MQNGYFAFRDQQVRIEMITPTLGIGSIPNPAPFLMSERGYGFFRNTFETGLYDLSSGQAHFSHKGSDFDVFCFFGGSLKSVLEGYTWITGRPFLIPRWGLEFGDADCYNDTGTTLDGFTSIASNTASTTCRAAGCFPTMVIRVDTKTWKPSGIHWNLSVSGWDYGQKMAPRMPLTRQDRPAWVFTNSMWHWWAPVTGRPSSRASMPGTA
jgi:hypothetical protein